MTDLRPEALLALADKLTSDLISIEEEYDTMDEAAATLRAIAALEGFAKMQPVAWMNTTHYADVTLFTRRSEEAERWGTSAVPLYRKGE
jgi:hypothetical protein